MMKERRIFQVKTDYILKSVIYMQSTDLQMLRVWRTRPKANISYTSRI